MSMFMSLSQISDHPHKVNNKDMNGEYHDDLEFITQPGLNWEMK